MSYAITAIVVILLSILFEKHVSEQILKGSIKPTQAEKLVRVVDLITAITAVILVALAIFTSL